MNPLAVLDSVLCARLVLTLGHLLWQAAALGALAFAVVWLLRRASANARYAVLLTALCLTAACPPVTFLLVDVAPEQVPRPSPAPAVAPLEPAAAPAPRAADLSDPPGLSDPSGASDPHPSPFQGDPHGTGGLRAALEVRPERLTVPGRAPATPPAAPWWHRFAPHLTLAYLAGVLVMAVRLLIGVGSGRRLRRMSEPIEDGDLLALIMRQARRIGLKSAPAVRWCAKIAAPTVVGVFRATILLPLGLATGLSADQMAALLTHELAHVRRYDHLVNILQRLIEAALFYHPAVWLLSRRIRIEREHCCDDAVVAAGGEPVAYADSLVQVAERSLSARARRRASVASVGAADRPSRLRRRVLRLIGGPGGCSARVSRPLLAVAILATFAAVGLAVYGCSLIGSLGPPEDASAFISAKVVQRQLVGVEIKEKTVVVTDAEQIARLASFFPGLGQGRAPLPPAGWVGRVFVTFTRNDGTTLEILSTYERWSALRKGDWPVKGDLKSFIEALFSAPATRPVEALSISLHAERDTLLVGEPLVVWMRITNVSDRPVMIPSTWGTGKYMRLKITTNGTERTETFARPGDYLGESAHELQPGEVYPLAATSDLYPFMERPGRQTFVATFRSPGHYPRWNREAQQTEDVPCWAGEVTSGPLTITVRALENADDIAAWKVMQSETAPEWSATFAVGVKFGEREPSDKRFHTVLERFPKSIFAPYCAFALAKAWAERVELSTDYLNNTVRHATQAIEGPRPFPFSDDAELLLARTYVRWHKVRPFEGANRKAQTHLKHLLNTWPQSDSAEPARELLASVAARAAQPTAPVEVLLNLSRFKEGAQVDIWVLNTSSKPIVLEDIHQPSWGVFTWFDFALDGRPVQAASRGSYTLLQPRPTRTLEPAQRLLWGSVLICSSHAQIEGHDGYTPFIVAPAGRHTLTVSPRPKAWGLAGIEQAVSAPADIIVNPSPPATRPADPDVSRLIEQLESPDMTVRLAAVDALAEMGPAASVAVPTLIGLLKDEERSVAGWAARALGMIGDSRAVMPLVALLADQHVGAHRAVDALIELAHPDAWDPLQASASATLDPNFRRKIEIALGAIAERDMDAVFPKVYRIDLRNLDPKSGVTGKANVTVREGDGLLFIPKEMPVPPMTWIEARGNRWSSEPLQVDSAFLRPLWETAGEPRRHGEPRRGWVRRFVADAPGTETVDVFYVSGVIPQGIVPSIMVKVTIKPLAGPAAEAKARQRARVAQQIAALAATPASAPDFVNNLLCLPKTPFALVHKDLRRF